MALLQGNNIPFYYPNYREIHVSSGHKYWTASHCRNVRNLFSDDKQVYAICNESLVKIVQWHINDKLIPRKEDTLNMCFFIQEKYKESI